MKKSLLHNYNIVTFLIRNILFAIFITTFLTFLNILNITLFITFENIVYLVSLLMFFLFLLFFEKEGKEKNRKIFEKKFKFFFLVGLCLITLGGLNFEIIKNIGLFDNLITSIKSTQAYLITLTIFCGFFTFYFNSERIEIEREQEEGKSGKKASRYLYFIPLFILLLYASLLIFPNLGQHDIYHDESWHINILDSLKKGDGFYLRDYVLGEPTTPYKQGYLTNLGSYLFYSISGSSTFGARVFVAITGLFNLVLIYFISKKLSNKVIAFFTTFFLSYNIIFLYLSRFLRQYSLFLFFYLLTFFFLIKLTESLKKHNSKKSLQNFFAVLLFTILALSEREMAKILLVILPIYLTAISLKYRSFIYGEVKKHKKAIIFLIFPLTILILLVLNHLQIIHLGNIILQAFEFFSLEKMNTPTKEYYYYLFQNNIKNTALLYVFSLTGFLFILKDIKTKPQSLLLLLFFIVPLFFNIYLLERYEDFRYILHVIPFTLYIIIFGMYKITSLYINKKSLQYIFLVILLFLTTYIMVPFNTTSNSLFIKSISEWETEGGIYLHRRAVSPEYTKAYKYLNEHQQSGDIVLINEATWNLKPKENVEYYGHKNIWGLSKSYSNFRDPNESDVDFFKLVNRESNLWFIGAYMHLLHPDLNNYLLLNCENISRELDIFKYDYNSYYQGNFYWPNLFLCKNDSEKTLTE